MIKYGVFRIGGIDHRDYATYLPMKAELQKNGGDLLFSEGKSGSGILAGWFSSQNIKIEKTNFNEILKCDVIDFADTEILCKTDDLNGNIRLIDTIPENVKIIVTIHSPESLKEFDNKQKDRITGFVLKWNMPLPSRFPLNKTYKGKHAIDTSFWRPTTKARNYPQNWFFVLYAGMIDYFKGFGELVDSFSEANKLSNQIKLGLAGFDPSNSAKHLAEKYKNNVFYWGFTISGDEMLNFLSTGNAFCQANFTNQGSHSSLEAMSSGLPLITIDHGFSETELIEDKKNGFLCKDAWELTEKFGYLAENRYLSDEMGKYSREKTIKEFGIESALKINLENLKRMGFDV